MTLTPFQQGALEALVAAAMGDAAAVLSDLVACPVTLDVPAVAVGGAGLPTPAPGGADVAVVAQGFSGRLNGTALLVLPVGDAARLAALLLGQDGDDVPDMDTRAVLTEVGNIVLNGLLGMMINTLHHGTDIHLPSYGEGDPRFLADALPPEHREGLDATLRVGVRGQVIAGRMVMLTAPGTLPAILDDMGVEA